MQIPVPDPAAAPAIPPRVRAWVYLVGLCLSGAGSTAIGIAAVLTPGSAAIVAGVVGAVLGGVGLVSNGLGVVYRPASLTARPPSPAD